MAPATHNRYRRENASPSILGRWYASDLLDIDEAVVDTTPPMRPDFSTIAAGEIALEWFQSRQAMLRDNLELIEIGRNYKRMVDKRDFLDTQQEIVDNELPDVSESVLLYQIRLGALRRLADALESEAAADLAAVERRRAAIVSLQAEIQLLNRRRRDKLSRAAGIRGEHG